MDGSKRTPVAAAVEPVSGLRGWLTRNLKVISGVSFLQDMAYGLLYPVLPIFLTVTLGAAPAIVGLIEGVADGASSIMKVVAGRLSDRYRRRPLIGLGYGLTTLGKVLLAMAGSWPTVLVARCGDRLGKAVRSAPRDAFIAAEVPVDTRGKAFGFHRSANSAGAVIGPLLGVAGYQLLHQQLRPLLVIAVVPAVASVMLVAALHEPAGPSAPIMRSRWRPGELPAGYWQVVAVLGGFSLINFSDALLLLRLHHIGFSVPAVILAYVIYNLVYTLLSYPAGVVTDRLSAAAVFGTGLVAFAVTYIGLGVTRDHLAAWLLIAGYGVFNALTNGVSRAWVSGLLPSTAQGTGQGVFEGLTGVGVLLASVWAGLAWGHDGTTPLLVSGLAAAILALGLLTSAIVSPQRHR
jgi:MFS family permease